MASENEIKRLMKSAEITLKAVENGTYDYESMHVGPGLTPKELLEQLEKNPSGHFFDYPGGFEKFKYDVEHGII